VTVAEKVFVSSVIAGYEDFRAAARDAVETLGYEPVMAEDFPASDRTPQQACLDGLRNSDVVVLLVADRYGHPQQSGLSATHEEFRDARDKKPVLVFVHDGVERDQRTTDLQHEVEDWASGGLAYRYAGADDLRRGITRAVADHFRSLAVGPVDDDELRRRLDSHLEESPRSGFRTPKRLIVAVVGGPTQQMLRPAEIEHPELAQHVAQAAMFGPHVVIDQEHGARNRLDAQGALVVGNDHQSVVLSPLGDVSVLTSLERSGGYDADRPLAELMGIVEDDIRPLLASSLGFAASLLDHIDGTHRLTTIAPGAVIHGAENGPWVTREEAERSSGRTSLGMG
jgi:hypothetical protein